MTLKSIIALTLLAVSQPSNAALLNLSDDSSTAQSIGFDFDFFGNTYDTVYVGSNGYLTFGNGDSDYTESVNEFLNNGPRIAVWDDFNPASGGSIITTNTSSFFQVSYESVPQYANSDSNSFDITLFNNGAIEIFFENLTTNDLLVGISGGNGSGTAVDLSSQSNFANTGDTIYELFNGNFDLNSETISFGTIATSVPEPSSIALLGLSIVGLSYLRRKKKS